MTFTDRETLNRPLVVVSVVALTGPAVLAFFAGGYFDGPRVWAGLITWVTKGAPAQPWKPRNGGPSLRRCLSER